MQPRILLSLAIAVALYLPILAAFFFILRSLEFERAQRQEFIPIALSYFEEPIAPSVATPPQPAIAAPNVADPKPPAEEKTPIEPKSEAGALSASELNALFAPTTLDEQTAQSAKPSETPSAIAAELGDLYGLMIRELTPEERRFMEQNLNPIQTITQRYLWQRGYPRLAVTKGMSGEVILGFTLFPNGDISSIETIRSSGWSLLDDHAIETILVAYKDYPRPSEQVRVRMRVTYQYR
ncbi:MAG: TonB family protein [Helicobacteraceae bacterium]|nr:TonB family protein [Helicobacteraceae bacterium]